MSMFFSLLFSVGLQEELGTEEFDFISRTNGWCLNSDKDLLRTMTSISWKDIPSLLFSVGL